MSTLTRVVLESTSGLAASPVSASAINLTWTANTRATGYRVYRNGTLIGSPTTNSYSDSGLTASTSYTYSVSTVAASGEGPPTAGVQGTTLAAPDTTAPTAPVITATATGQNTISVALTTPATDAQSGVASYDLEYKRAADATYSVITPVTAGQFPYIVGSLTAATAYNTRSRARDVVGNVGAYSTVSNATTQAATGTANTLYSPLDMAEIPFHNGAGAWGVQLPFETAALPNITRSVNASSLAQVQAAMNTPGARITLTANIVGGNISGSSLSDCEIVVPNGILADFILGQYGVTNWTRLRLTKASGDVIGGQWHNLFVTGSTLSDFICDGLQVSGNEAYGPAIYMALTTSQTRVAILRNRIKGTTSGYGFGATHMLVAGNSMRHNSSDVEGTGEWGFRSSQKGPYIFVDNDIRSVVTGYAPARWHPASGASPYYAYLARNTTVSRSQDRGFWFNDVEGTVGYPGIDAVWMLGNRHYVNGGFVMLMNRDSGGPTCAYVRANDNFVYGHTSGINTGGAPNGEALRNTYDPNPGSDPAWGAAGDPTGISTSP